MNPYTAVSLGYQAYGVYRSYKRKREEDLNNMNRKIGPFWDRPTSDQGAQYMQYVALRPKRIGRYVPRVTKAMRILQAQLLTKVDRFQNMNGIDNSTQPFALACYSDATNQYLPWYCFDLTMLQANINNAATWTGIPMLALSKNVASGNFQWLPQAGYLADGSSVSNKWQVERQPYSTVAANAPFEKAYLEWADIRLMMVGATNLPSSVVVQIVQFTDETIVPPAFYNNGSDVSIFPPPTAQPEYPEYSRYWHSEIDNLFRNPMNVRMQTQDNLGKTRLLYSRKYDFQPTSTTETDAGGHEKSIKIFHRLNRLMNYRVPNETSDPIVLNNVFNPNFWVAENTVTQCHVTPQNPRSRVFLVIKGMHAGAGAGAVTPGSYATFGLSVRRKLSVV